MLYSNAGRLPDSILVTSPWTDTDALYFMLDEVDLSQKLAIGPLMQSRRSSFRSRTAYSAALVLYCLLTYNIRESYLQVIIQATECYAQTVYLFTY